MLRKELGKNGQFAQYTMLKLVTEHNDRSKQKASNDARGTVQSIFWDLEQFLNECQLY